MLISIKIRKSARRAELLADVSSGGSAARNLRFDKSHEASAREKSEKAFNSWLAFFSLPFTAS
jgi:hypothetical protein